MRKVLAIGNVPQDGRVKAFRLLTAFLAMSLDGRSVCGVTTEEYAVWVVARSFE